LIPTVLFSFQFILNARHYDGDLQVCQINVNFTNPSSTPAAPQIVNNRRSAPLSPISSPYTPRSQRVRSRRRVILESPRPRRNRVQPRHFDSSPNLDEPRRCERRGHDAEMYPTVRRDFIDEYGHSHAICNRCRQLMEIERVVKDLSSFSLPDEVNDDNDGNGRSTSMWGFDAPLWNLNASSQLDFSKSELWTDRTQRLVDGFRSDLEVCQLRICQKCNRILPEFFSSDSAEQECHLCKNTEFSRFGADNNMDPGEVFNIEIGY